MRAVGLWVLAACGRLHFDPVGDGVVVAPDEIAVVVMSEGVDPAVPIGNATVLAGSGRFATDASGVAHVPATEPVSVHVVYAPNAHVWRVYTIGDVPPSTVVRLGGSARSLSAMMTLAFPTDPSAAGFTLYASLRCSAAMSVIPPTDFPHFAPDCAGESAHLTMLTAGDRSWLDGDITWVANGMAMLAGSYAPDVTYTIDITNVPATTTTIGAEVATLSADGRDYITQTIPAPSIVVAPTTTAMLAGAPGGDTLQLTIIDATVTMFTKVTTQRLRESGTTMAFDAAGMLPLFDNLVIATDATAQWSPQQQSADVIKVDGTIANTLWTAILPGSATSLAFPALPSDLAAADPTGQPWGDASVEAIAFPGGLTAADRFALDTQQPPWLVSVSSINYAAQ